MDDDVAPEPRPQAFASRKRVLPNEQCNTDPSKMVEHGHLLVPELYEILPKRLCDVFERKGKAAFLAQAFVSIFNHRPLNGRSDEDSGRLMSEEAALTREEGEEITQILQAYVFQNEPAASGLQVDHKGARFLFTLPWGHEQKTHNDSVFFEFIKGYNTSEQFFQGRGAYLGVHLPFHGDRELGLSPGGKFKPVARNLQNPIGQVSVELECVRGVIKPKLVVTEHPTTIWEAFHAVSTECLRCEEQHALKEEQLHELEASCQTVVGNEEGRMLANQVKALKVELADLRIEIQRLDAKAGTLSTAHVKNTLGLVSLDMDSCSQTFVQLQQKRAAFIVHFVHAHTGRAGAYLEQSPPRTQAETSKLKSELRDVENLEELYKHVKASLFFVLSFHKVNPPYPLDSAVNMSDLLATTALSKTRVVWMCEKCSQPFRQCAFYMYTNQWESQKWLSNHRICEGCHALAEDSHEYTFVRYFPKDLEELQLCLPVAQWIVCVELDERYASGGRVERDNGDGSGIFLHTRAIGSYSRKVEENMYDEKSFGATCCAMTEMFWNGEATSAASKSSPARMLDKVARVATMSPDFFKDLASVCIDQLCSGRDKTMRLCFGGVFSNGRSLARRPLIPITTALVDTLKSMVKELGTTRVYPAEHASTITHLSRAIHPLGTVEAVEIVEQRMSKESKKSNITSFEWASAELLKRKFVAFMLKDTTLDLLFKEVHRTSKY